MILTLLSIIAVVAILVGFNALYVAGEFSTVSARRTRLIHMAEDGNRLANMLLPVINDHHRLDSYIAASQVGITLSSVVLGIYGEQQVAPLIEPLLEQLPFISGPAAASGIATTLILLIFTTLQVVFGELLPKSIGLQYPERLALATAIPMKWSADYILKPLIVLLNGSGRLILNILGVEYGGEHAHVHSPEEIVILVSESHEGGLLDADERRMLRGVFRVSEISAEEIARPRPQLVAASIDEPVEGVLRRAAESAYTRIPVYRHDIDHIVGFVHLRDLYNLYHEDPGAALGPIVREVPYVPETLPIIEVWRTLNEEQSYLAIVIDEYGGTAGMITWEDLVEELFGEIQDEFDQERALITPAGDGRLVVRGDMTITQLNDVLDVKLPHDVSHTVGGFVLDRLGRIPQVGDEITEAGVRLRVEAVANLSANAISVARIEPPPEHDAKAGR
jgi:putative hemolysin